MKNPARHFLKYWRIFADPQVVWMHGVKVNTPREMPKALRHSIFKGTWEYEAARMIKKIVRPGDKVLEIGAGLGVTGLVATKRAGEGNVLSCEADANSEQAIRDNYRLNGWEAKLIMQPITSDGRSVRLFKSQDCNPERTSLFRKEKTFEGGEIASRAIGEVLKEHPPDVLIMDAEGSEAELLPLATLPKTRAVIVEMHPYVIGNEAVKEIVEAMKRSGFNSVRKAKMSLRSAIFHRPERICDYLFERSA